MAEIQEVFEDFSENVKKTVKNKPFIAVAVGVGAVGLFVWWKKQKTTANNAVAYEPIGYGGYPEVSGSISGGSGGSDDSALYEQLIYENSSYYEKLLGDMESSYTTEIADLNNRVDALHSSALDSEERAATTAAALKREQTISQMRANSDLYNVITDRATKDALHAENQALAAEMGWTFDPTSGNYFEGNSVVYTTTKQEAGAINFANRPAAGQASNQYTNNAEYNKQVTESVLKSTAGASLGYDPSVDYSLAIVQAKETGASAEQIQALQTARQNKIDSMYGGNDPASKETQAKIK